MAYHKPILFMEVSGKNFQTDGCLCTQKGLEKGLDKKFWLSIMLISFAWDVETKKED